MAIDTGFGSDITGMRVVIDPRAAQQGADVVNRAFDSMPDHADSATSRIGKSLNRLRSSLFSVGGAFTGLGLGLFAREVLRADVTMAKIINTLRTATGSAALASIEFHEIKQISKDLAVDLGTAANAYARLSAATRGTNTEGKATKELFKGVAAAVTASGGGAYELYLALKAVEQMASKGRVQMEELRGQLGDVLPGAFNLAANAIGKTTQQMNRDMKKGLSADEFLPKFGPYLFKQFEEAARQAGNSIIGVLNRWKTLKLEMLSRVDSGGFAAALGKSLDKLEILVTKPEFQTAMRNIGELLAKGIDLFSQALVFAGNHLDYVKAGLAAVVAIKAVSFFSSVTTVVKELRDALISLNTVKIAGSISDLVSRGGKSGATSVAAVSGIDKLKQSFPQLFTKSGKKLTASQLAAKTASSSFDGDASKMASELSALGKVLDKNGKVLSQTAFNARLASKEMQGLGIAARSAQKAMASSVGLQTGLFFVLQGLLPTIAKWFAQIFSVGFWTAAGTNILNAVRNFSLMATVGPRLAAVFGSLSGLLTTIGTRLIALAYSNPFTAIAVSVGIAVVGMIAFRNHLITIGGHTARLKDYFYVLGNFISSVFLGIWRSVADTVASAFNKIAETVTSVVSKIMGRFKELKELLFSIAKPYVDNMKQYYGILLTYMENELWPKFQQTKFYKFFSENQVLGGIQAFPALAEQHMITERAGQAQGYFDPITNQRVNRSDPGGLALAAAMKPAARKKYPGDVNEPKESAAEKMLKKLQAENEWQEKINKAMLSGTEILTKESGIIETLTTKLKAAAEIAGLGEKVPKALKDKIENEMLSLGNKQNFAQAADEVGKLTNKTTEQIRIQKELNTVLGLGNDVLDEVRAKQENRAAIEKIVTNLTEDEKKRLGPYIDQLTRLSQELGNLDAEGRRLEEGKRLGKQLLYDFNPLIRYNEQLRLINLAEKANANLTAEANKARHEAAMQLKRDQVDELQRLVSQQQEIRNIGITVAELRVQMGKGNKDDLLVSVFGNYIKGFEGFTKTTTSLYQNMFATIADGAATSLGRAIVYGENLGDALKDVARSALSELISGFIKMGIQMLITHFLGKTIAKMATAASIAQAAAVGAAWAAPAAMVNTATFGAASAAGTIGLTAAVGVAAALVASGIAVGSGTAAASNAPAGAPFADGGPVFGRGTSTSDSIKARLSNGEYVMKAAAVKRIGIPELNRLNSGTYGRNSNSIGRVQLNVQVLHDGSTGVEVQQISESEVRIIAKQEARKTVEQKTPGIVASQMANPNSQVSKSMQRNTTVRPRR